VVGLGEFEFGFAGKVFEEGFKGGQRRVTNSRPSSRQPKSRAESSSMDSAWRVDLPERLEVMSWRISEGILEIWQMVREVGLILACLFQRLGLNKILSIPALGFSRGKNC
jgi:hypothetical protein